MKKVTVPLLRSIPARMAMLMYYLLWSYHFCEEAQNGGMNFLVNVQLFIEYFNRLNV